MSGVGSNRPERTLAASEGRSADGLSAVSSAAVMSNTAPISGRSPPSSRGAAPDVDIRAALKLIRAGSSRAPDLGTIRCRRRASRAECDRLVADQPCPFDPKRWLAGRERHVVGHYGVAEARRHLNRGTRDAVPYPYSDRLLLELGDTAPRAVLERRGGGVRGVKYSGPRALEASADLSALRLSRKPEHDQRAWAVQRLKAMFAKRI
jgi:hypothetical protein